MASATAARDETGADDGIALVYIESARLCNRKVTTYSDFAYIRPSYETVVGSVDCNGSDGMGEADVIWWRQDVADRWTPPPDIERKQKFSLSFRKGGSVPQKSNAMDALLAVAKANPGKPIRLTVFSDKGEPKQAAERRIKAIRAWLSGKGVDQRRVVVAGEEQGSPRIEAEIVVVLKG